jgi:hypothetical protein
MEFWSAIAEEEINRSNKAYGKTVFGYCDYFCEDLLPIFISILEKRDKLVDEEWNLAKSITTVVNQFSQLVSKFSFINNLVEFIASK